MFMFKKGIKLNARQKKTLDSYFGGLSSKIQLDGILLFGSYAYGRPNKHSDIDLVVLSKDFAGMSFYVRLFFLSKMRRGVAESEAMDVIGYTPCEFRHVEKESAILEQAKKGESG